MKLSRKSGFTSRLLAWNRLSNCRKMPWKGEKDPYRVWLSEVILQQTRVEQGLAYYERFIQAYPTVHGLAAAPDQQVFKLWEGLGYYSRCKNLLATARYISAGLAGKFPDTYEEILRLKGIGPYTAAAIASFAFNEKRAVVDGNVLRVLARYTGFSLPIDSPEGRKSLDQLAASLIDSDSPAEYNQAIMDFGATVCKPRNPLCSECVQAAECVAFRKKLVDVLPVKAKKPKRSKRWFYYFVLESGNTVYIRRREEKDIWQNLHEFVLLEKDEPQEDPGADFLNSLLQNRSYTVRYQSEEFMQQLTHQEIRGRFYIVSLSTKPKLDNYIPVRKKNIADYAFPKLINSFLEASSLHL